MSESAGAAAREGPRRAAVLTTGRQDWGIVRELCRLMRAEPAHFGLRLLVGGMHWSARHGLTHRIVEADGFDICERLDWMGPGSATSPAAQGGGALTMTAAALIRQCADYVVLVGDRFETAAAAVGATLSRVPVVHLHGGEETVGAIDNSLRHAISKLSHLHFTSHEHHAARVVAMGEDPATVHTVGAPGLDNLWRADLPDRAELEKFLGLKLEPPVVLVTVHPATLAADPAADAVALAAALDAVEATYLITLPNSDPGNEEVRAAMLRAAERPRRRVVEALGERYYWAALKLADAMAGNSSSALIEAPAVGLPAVNVGLRQEGRLRGANLVDAPADSAAIAAALRRALEPEFRRAAAAAPSPFGKGGASRRIAEVLARWQPPQPPVKAGVAAPRIPAPR